MLDVDEELQKIGGLSMMVSVNESDHGDLNSIWAVLISNLLSDFGGNSTTKTTIPNIGNFHHCHCKPVFPAWKGFRPDLPQLVIE